MNLQLFEPEVKANQERAEESLRAAQLLYEAGHWDFAAARAYYAAFHAATAVLLSEGKEYQKHSGVIAAIHKFLVKTGKLDKENGKNLNWLFELRCIGDYATPGMRPKKTQPEPLQWLSHLLRLSKNFCQARSRKTKQICLPVPLIGIDTWKIKNTNYRRPRRYSVCLAGGDCAGSHLSNFDLLCSPAVGRDFPPGSARKIMT